MTATGATAIDAIARFYADQPVDRLGVAVSGGSDSLALLLLLHDWGRADLYAITVNHRLRPEAASEALHVAKICEKLDIPHDVREWQGWDGRGNLQAEARRSRYSLISQWAHENGIGAVAVGHTQNDQAETLLMRLGRGAGVEGLARMRTRASHDGIAIHRPLLDVTRAGLRGFLKDRGVRWVDDPSNSDENYERVRVRQALEVLGPLGIDTTALARVAANLEDARYAIAWALANWAEGAVRVAAGDVIFDRTKLLALPSEMKRQAFSQALRWISGADYPPRRDALAGLIASVRQGENTTLHGCYVMTSAMTVRITRELAPVRDVSCPTDTVWDRRWRLEGPHMPGFEIRALGDAVHHCPDWRETGLPRQTLLASPSVWDGETLVCAPIAGFSAGWTAKTGDKSDFAAFLISH